MITGGAGFLGHHLVDAILKIESNVIVVDNLSKGELKNLEKHFHNPNFKFIQGNLRDLTFAKEVMKDIDICFHLAALIGGIGYFHKIPATLLRDNCILTLNVFEAARDSSTEIVYASSSMVFERTKIFPTPETAINESPPPITAYGFSKLAGEYIARSFNEEFGIPFLIFRPFNMYGPGELVGDYVGYSHVIPDLIKKILQNQYPLEILGSGDQTRCYSFVKDVVDGILLITKKARNDDFNIGSEKETSVKELAAIIWKIAGRKEDLKFKHMPPFKDDVQRRVPDISKIKKLGWEPKTDLETGLKITFEWIKNKLQ